MEYKDNLTKLSLSIGILHFLVILSFSRLILYYFRFIFILDTKIFYFFQRIGFYNQHSADQVCIFDVYFNVFIVFHAQSS